MIRDAADLKAWLGGSRALDEARAPVVAYRVVSASLEGSLRPASASLMDMSSASAMAEQLPGAALEPAYLRIQRPLVESPDDDQVQLAHLTEVLGLEDVRRLAAKYAGEIERTGSFEPWRDRYGSVLRMAERADEHELRELVLPAAVLLDDPQERQLLTLAGFDGAIAGHGGSCRWWVFGEDQVLPAIASGWPARLHRVAAEASPSTGEVSPARMAAVDHATRELIGTEPSRDHSAGLVVTTTSALRDRVTIGGLGPARSLLIALPGISDRLRGELAASASTLRKLAREIADPAGEATILRRPGQAQWVAVGRAADGSWSGATLDEDGIRERRSFASRQEGLKTAALAGFTVRDDGALTRLLDTPRFTRGLLDSVLIEMVQRGQISLAQRLQQLVTHDALSMVLASVSRNVAQAAWDPRTGSVFLLADRIAPGHEGPVLMHELMHKHGRMTLGAAGWSRLIGVLRSCVDMGMAGTPLQKESQAMVRACASAVQRSGPGGDAKGRTAGAFRGGPTNGRHSPAADGAQARSRALKCHSQTKLSFPLGRSSLKGLLVPAPSGRYRRAHPRRPAPKRLSEEAPFSARTTEQGASAPCLARLSGRPLREWRLRPRRAARSGCWPERDWASAGPLTPSGPRRSPAGA